MRSVAIALCMCLGSASAQEALVGYGAGAQGCGKYIENRRTPDTYYDGQVASWFYGFVSAYNFYGRTGQIKRTLDQATVLAYFDKYCRENPLSSMSIGATELVKVYAK